MNILVCVKQVPDAKDVRLDPKTNTLAREGVESIMNPYDRHALEEAVAIRERQGGTVTVLTMGPPQAEAVPLIPLFERLTDAGLVLGVATNDGEVPARAHLTRAGIADSFAFVSGYDSGYGAKPEPGMCLGFARATGLDPSECAMIGDSTSPKAG